MENIIKKAIEGGWNGGKEYPQTPEQVDHVIKLVDTYSKMDEGVDETMFKQWLESAVLDPLFWQALIGRNWEKIGVEFHEKNLLEGWETAIKWLQEKIDSLESDLRDKEAEIEKLKNELKKYID